MIRSPGSSVHAGVCRRGSVFGKTDCRPGFERRQARPRPPAREKARRDGPAGLGEIQVSHHNSASATPGVAEQAKQTGDWQGPGRGLGQGSKRVGNRFCRQRGGEFGQAPTSLVRRENSCVVLNWANRPERFGRHPSRKGNSLRVRRAHRLLGNGEARGSPGKGPAPRRKHPNRTQGLQSLAPVPTYSGRATSAM